MTGRLMLAAVAVLASCCMPAPAEAPPNANSPLAINLAGIADWSSDLAFVDVFKQSRQWISQKKGQPWGKGETLDLDANGWVKRLKDGQYAETPVCNMGGHNPPGEYICLYDGRGRIDFWGDGKVKSRAPGRIVVEVTPKGSTFLRITETDPADYIRNIRLILPGFEKTYKSQPFHPAFLKRGSRFRAIRFMDWGATNGSPVAKWSQRSTPQRQTQSGPQGVALEYMIDLANTLAADPWLCIPHQADDDFVRRCAQMVKARLDAKRKVYIEYSNECWNSVFKQAHYCGQKGRELKLSKNAYQAQLFYYSRRAVEIFGIFEQVFGSADRLVRVLAAQSANPWTSSQVATFNDAYKHADALGIAPYFGHRMGSPKTQNDVAKWPVDKVLDACEKAIAKNRQTLARQAAIAKQHNLDLIAYEGGQHLVGHGGAENNKALEKLLHAANRHARMRELYLKDLAGWKESGGKLFAVFSSMGRYSKWGSWGIIEHFDQDPKTAPKYRAVMEFIDKNPKWWK